MSYKTQILAETGKHDFKIIREFATSRENAFKAFAEPDLFVQWFMPKEMNLVIEKMDCQTGGSFKNSHTHPNGQVFGFQGVYHEVTKPHLIIKTSEFVGLNQKMPPVLEITNFENTENGHTKVTVHTFCTSSEYRDALIQNGMEQHVQISQLLLDKLFEKL
jgi:uncharacterized protein YndB with AHSA1/START domain